MVCNASQQTHRCLLTDNVVGDIHRRLLRVLANDNTPVMGSARSLQRKEGKGRQRIRGSHTWWIVTSEVRSR